MIYEFFDKSNLEFYNDVSDNFLNKKEVCYFLERLIRKEINIKEAIQEIEALKFKNVLLEYLEENKEKDSVFENYKQYKKILKNDREKFLQFCEVFKIKNEEKFYKDYENWIKEQGYPEDFYNNELRESLLNEQNKKCAMCDRNNIYYFQLHHIDYDKKNCKKENLFFLCPKCHGKTNSNRSFWELYLKEKKKHTF
jgi:hypothetical protein